MLFLNFGSKARAEQYLAQKLAKGLPGAEVKSFEVPKSFLDECVLPPSQKSNSVWTLPWPEGRCGLI